MRSHKDTARRIDLVTAAAFCTLLFFSLSLPCVGEEKDALKHQNKKNTQIMLISGHPNYPPFMWKQDEKIAGAGVDLIKLICEELDIAYKIEWSGPWKRVQSLAKYGNLDLIVGLYSNEERRQYLDYTIPYKTDPTSITVLKDKGFNYTAREDLIGKMGITMHGDSFGEAFDKYIKSKLNVKSAYTAEAIFKNLLDGRIDYILWGYYPTVINAKKAGVSDKITIFDTPVVTENMYMAISKKSSFKGSLHKINSLIKRYKADGTVAKIIEKNLSLYNKKSGI